jgi:hypothetical protein
MCPSFCAMASTGVLVGHRIMPLYSVPDSLPTQYAVELLELYRLHNRLQLNLPYHIFVRPRAMLIAGSSQTVRHGTAFLDIKGHSRVF